MGVTKELTTGKNSTEEIRNPVEVSQRTTREAGWIEARIDGVRLDAEGDLIKVDVEIPCGDTVTWAFPIPVSWSVDDQPAARIVEDLGNGLVDEVEGEHVFVKNSSNEGGLGTSECGKWTMAIEEDEITSSSRTLLEEAGVSAGIGMLVTSTAWMLFATPSMSPDVVFGLVLTQAVAVFIGLLFGFVLGFALLITVAFLVSVVECVFR